MIDNVFSNLNYKNVFGAGHKSFECYAIETRKELSWNLFHTFSVMCSVIVKLSSWWLQSLKLLPDLILMCAKFILPNLDTLVKNSHPSWISNNFLERFMCFYGVACHSTYVQIISSSFSFNGIKIGLLIISY